MAKRQKTRVGIFELNIELNDNYSKWVRWYSERTNSKERYKIYRGYPWQEDDYYRLHRDEEYLFPVDTTNGYSERTRSVTYEEIVSSIQEYVNDGLNKEFKKIKELPVKRIHVSAVYPGSISAILTAVFNFCGTVSSLKDTYECCKACINLIEKYINRRLGEDYGDFFRVAVKRIAADEEKKYSASDDSDSEQVYVGKGNNFNGLFFLYLAVTNVGLMAGLGILVYKVLLKG